MHPCCHSEHASSPGCTGVTGSRAQVEDRVEGLIDALHEASDKPVAVGFGVSGPKQVHPSLSAVPFLAIVLDCHS